MKSNKCCQIWVNFFRNNQPVCYPELGRTHRHSFWFEPIRELVTSKTIWSFHIYHIWSWNLHPNPKKSRIISWWHLFHGTIFWHISTAWSQLWLLQCLNHLRQNAASQTGWVTGWVLVSFPNWSSWLKIVGFWLYNIWQHVVIIYEPTTTIHHRSKPRVFGVNSEWHVLPHSTPSYHRNILSPLESTMTSNGEMLGTLLFVFGSDPAE